MDLIVFIVSIVALLIIGVLLYLLSQRVPRPLLTSTRQENVEVRQQLLHAKEVQTRLSAELAERKEDILRHQDQLQTVIKDHSGLESRLDILSQQLMKEQRENLTQTQELKVQQESLAQFRESVAELQSVRSALEDKLNQQEQSLKEQSKNLIEVFKNEAQRAFDEKSEKFTAENKINIENILKPLNEKIKDFQHRVEETHKDTIDRHASLRQQILNLRDLNETMSREAKQLTKALKGDSKIQGNWGEMVLQRVLEKSGLDKGREYEIQQSFQTDEGRKQPDVIIHMPDNKILIIDSKVSLVAYERMINSEDESKDQFEKSHLISLNNHVEQLSAKRYHDIYQMESPDFVLMFVPIETAFSIAVNSDPELYTRAFDKNIIIVTPSTLLATLKVVDTMWQYEKQKRNSIEIATEAGKMYDKFVALLDDLKKVGQQMDTAKKTYGAAMNKLHEGSGNMIRRAENLKRLGAKASKSIDPKWLDRSGDQDDEVK